VNDVEENIIVREDASAVARRAARRQCGTRASNSAAPLPNLVPAAWIEGSSKEELVLREAAELLSRARSRGYRTPHKC
jgi:hypothetical protein